jgi:gluconolactonase
MGVVEHLTSINPKNALSNMKRTLVLTLSVWLALAQNSSVIRLPDEWLYLLPQPFNSSIEYNWLNSTTTGNTTINAALAAARESRFVSYSDEFSAIVGSNPGIKTIPCPASAPYCAYEGGTWIPDTDEVWFNYDGFYYSYTQAITSFDLRNNTSHQLSTNPPIRYPYGTYLYNDLVYMTEFNVTTDPATIITVDPKTLQVTPILNSYLGIPLAPCDDLVVTRVNNKDYIFLTTFPIADIITQFPRQRFDTAVWRFDLQEKVLTPVISANEILAPNGIQVSPDGRTLYVTNTATTNFESQASNSTIQNSIMEYDLNDQGKPVNGRLFALVRTGIANGLHIDNQGRVWTCEDDGINVRSPGGRLLGVFNYYPFKPTSMPRIGNFALAGNRLVIGAVGYALVYELNETLVTPGNILAN